MLQEQQQCLREKLQTLCYYIGSKLCRNSLLASQSSALQLRREALSLEHGQQRRGKIVSRMPHTLFIIIHGGRLMKSRRFITKLQLNTPWVIRIVKEACHDDDKKPKQLRTMCDLIRISNITAQRNGTLTTARRIKIPMR